MSGSERCLFRSTRFAIAAVALLTGATVHAQWVTYQNETATRSNVAAAVFSADPEEKDYGVGDFDMDGDDDLVVVRKQPATSAGGFPNVLLMNESGVLTDRTTLFASASAVSGAAGFLDATNDRDITVADVTGDGWPDLITAVTLGGNTAPKYMTHPRIYVNQGNDTSGNWLGFIFDDENRAPTMPAEPRFCAVSAGDIDGDGDLDLFFSDYDNGPYGRSGDVNDRLWINNGLGYFTDETATRMVAGSNASGFGANCVIIDVNQDGLLDIARHNVPTVNIVYNNPSNPGNFGPLQTAFAGSAYNFSIGDLNNDSKMDIISSDDGQDRYILGANVVGGQLTFGSEIPVTYTGGGADDGFSGTNKQVDLNNDGFDDVIIADFDVDVTGCGRRCHIFRNLGNLPNVTLQEQQISGSICGIPANQLEGTFDVAVMDINGDGYKDLVVGRCSGTAIWINQPPVGMSFSYPQGLPFFVAPGLPKTVQVQITPTGVSVINPSTATLWVSTGGAFTPQPLSSLGGNLFQGTLPALACIQEARFYVTCQDTFGTLRSDPPTAPAASYEYLGATGTSTIMIEDFEGTAPGWTVSNSPTLTAGAWELAVPNGGFLGSTMIVPATDAEQSTLATKCFVTKNASAPSSNFAFLMQNDVDGGYTDLISPIFNLAGTDGNVSFSRWFWGTSGLDSMVVSISNDGGSTWTSAATIAVTGGSNAWLVNSFRVGDFIPPTNQMRVRFRAEDSGFDNLVEGGIDAFRVDRYDCSICQPSVGLQGPGTTTLTVCGGNLTAGTTAVLSYAGGDPFNVAYLIADVALVPTPFAQGMSISPNPPIVSPVSLDAQGGYALNNVPGGIGPLTVYVQAVRIAAVPGFLDFSNGVSIVWP